MTIISMTAVFPTTPAIAPIISGNRMVGCSSELGGSVIVSMELLLMVGVVMVCVVMVDVVLVGVLMVGLVMVGVLIVGVVMVGLVMMGGVMVLLGCTVEGSGPPKEK